MYKLAVHHKLLAILCFKSNRFDIQVQGTTINVGFAAFGFQSLKGCSQTTSLGNNDIMHKRAMWACLF